MFTIIWSTFIAIVIAAATWLMLQQLMIDINKGKNIARKILAWTIATPIAIVIWFVVFNIVLILQKIGSELGW